MTDKKRTYPIKPDTIASRIHAKTVRYAIVEPLTLMIIGMLWMALSFDLLDARYDWILQDGFLFGFLIAGIICTAFLAIHLFASLHFPSEINLDEIDPNKQLTDKAWRIVGVDVPEEGPDPKTPSEWVIYWQEMAAAEETHASANLNGRPHAQQGPKVS